MIVDDFTADLRQIADGLGVPCPVLTAAVLDLPGFSEWPASLDNKHHRWPGGLVEHTWEVVTLCLKTSMFFAETRHMDMPGSVPVYLAALYHDVGKVWDYTRERTEEGGYRWVAAPDKRLIHHISRSALFWEASARKVRCHQPMRDEVLHAILSHHGRREWGSPVGPKTRLAWLLHTCDQLSARMDDCDRIDQFASS